MKNKTTFLGIVNGVQYNDVQSFKQAVKNMCEPNHGENTVQPIIRPAIYSSDEDYIIPMVTEFHFENLTNLRGDVTKKLEQRMAYFAQEFSNGNISTDILQCLIDKAKQGIIDIQHHIDELSNIITFLTPRAVDIYEIVEEKVATEDILGFYVTMLDNFEDYLKREQPIPKVLQKETTDAVDTVIAKIKDLDAAQIDQLVRALQNR